MFPRQKIGDSCIWRFTGVATHEPGDLMMAPMAGQVDNKGPRPSRPVHVMVGRLKTEGMRNISFTRKQDPYLYPTCNRE